MSRYEVGIASHTYKKFQSVTAVSNSAFVQVSVFVVRLIDLFIRVSVLDVVTTFTHSIATTQAETLLNVVSVVFHNSNTQAK